MAIVLAVVVGGLVQDELPALGLRVLGDGGVFESSGTIAIGGRRGTSSWPTALIWRWYGYGNRGQKAMGGATRRPAPVRRCGGVLPAVLEAIAVAVHLEDVDVVGEAVQQRGGEPFGAEHVSPLVERKIGGHQDGAAFVALAEDLEEQFRPGEGQGQVSSGVHYPGTWSRARRDGSVVPQLGGRPGCRGVICGKAATNTPAGRDSTKLFILLFILLALVDRLGLREILMCPDRDMDNDAGARYVERPLL